MTVKELIEKLKELPQDKKWNMNCKICYTFNGEQYDWR